MLVNIGYGPDEMPPLAWILIMDHLLVMDHMECINGTTVMDLLVMDHIE